MATQQWDQHDKMYSPAFNWLVYRENWYTCLSPQGSYQLEMISFWSGHLSLINVWTQVNINWPPYLISDSHMYHMSQHDRLVCACIHHSLFSVYIIMLLYINKKIIYKHSKAGWKIIINYIYIYAFDTCMHEAVHGYSSSSWTVYFLYIEHMPRLPIVGLWNKIWAMSIHFNEIAPVDIIL